MCQGESKAEQQELTEILGDPANNDCAIEVSCLQVSFIIMTAHKKSIQKISFILVEIQIYFLHPHV